MGLAASGCGSGGNDFGRLEEVWGRRGIINGRFQRPRAMAIDNQDRLFIVDFLARIHVFTAKGEFLHAWQMPTWENGKPTGITVQHGEAWGQGPEADRVLLADTHYFRVMAFTLDGQLVEEETVGGTNGTGPGEFGFVTDAQRDSSGCLYVSEYGGYDRIQKFSPDGEYLTEWGQYGEKPGEFSRPQNFVIDAQNRLWVCDACNHRIQVFDTEGELLQIWGEPGREPGQLSYPYDIALAGDGTLYLCEFGNHRIQQFTTEGKPLGCWGAEGRGEGQLHSPWSCVLDSRNRLHVLDTWNHRVQRVKV